MGEQFIEWERDMMIILMQIVSRFSSQQFFSQRIAMRLAMNNNRLSFINFLL